MLEESITGLGISGMSLIPGANPAAATDVRLEADLRGLGAAQRTPRYRRKPRVCSTS